MQTGRMGGAPTHGLQGGPASMRSEFLWHVVVQVQRDSRMMRVLAVEVDKASPSALIIKACTTEV